ncbi:MAG: hypothetical protein ABFS24_15335 [Pseudomonadota bacterium]
MPGDSDESLDRRVIAYDHSYAVVFGTGVYQVKDQEAFVFRVPLSYRVREPSRERPVIKLLLPALTGFYDYDHDKIFQGESPGGAATLSVVPGDNRSKSVSGEFEWGLALDFRKPRNLMGFKFDRIGLGFRYGDNIRGVRLVTRFPF